jgi:hypothetical protein
VRVHVLTLLSTVSASRADSVTALALARCDSKLGAGMGAWDGSLMLAQNRGAPLCVRPRGPIHPSMHTHMRTAHTSGRSHSSVTGSYVRERRRSSRLSTRMRWGSVR